MFTTEHDKLFAVFCQALRSADKEEARAALEEIKSHGITVDQATEELVESEEEKEESIFEEEEKAQEPAKEAPLTTRIATKEPIVLSDNFSDVSDHVGSTVSYLKRRASEARSKGKSEFTIKGFLVKLAGLDE